MTTRAKLRASGKFIPNGPGPAGYRYLWLTQGGGFFRVVLSPNGRVHSEPNVNSSHINRQLREEGWR
jgi:hypothetical protein